MQFKVFTFGSMKKWAIGILFISLIIVFGNSKIFAQEEPQPQQQDMPPPIPKKSFKDRLFTGGNIGLQFGTVTYVDISPKLGYKITDKLAAGIGATYIYINDRTYQSFGQSYTSDIYGGRLFGQYQIIENVMAYSEFEVLNAQVQNDLPPYALSRTNIPSWLVGGGYVQPIGARSNAVILVLWNLIESRYSIYQNPIIRVGFNIGF